MVEESDWMNVMVNHKPLLTWIASSAAEEFVQMAIDNGSDIELKDLVENRTALDWAVLKNNINAVKVLLRNKADINGFNGPDDEWTCFHTAVKVSILEVVNMLLADERLNVNARMKSSGLKFSALHLAVRRGNVEIAENILKIENVDINIMSSFNRTPLYDAVLICCNEHSSANFKIINILLENGADPNIGNFKNNTPLIVATEHNNYELVKLLLDYAADMDFKNNDKESALSIASENIENEIGIEITKLLLRAKISGDCKPQYYYNLLKEAKRALDNIDCENHQMVSALGLLLLETKESRKIITDYPELWNVKERKPTKFLKQSWLEKYASGENSGNRSCFYEHETVNESMLTWAIVKCQSTVNILLQSDIKSLPFEWKSNLCVKGTNVGTPIRCAIDQENFQAVDRLMDVLKRSWTCRYSTVKKQRKGVHLLDHLQYQDLLYTASSYPYIFADFIDSVDLVEAYNWVPGLRRTFIAPNTTWVGLSSERSPDDFWKNYVEINGNFKRNIFTWNQKKELYKDPNLVDDVKNSDGEDGSTNCHEDSSDTNSEQSDSDATENSLKGGMLYRTNEKRKCCCVERYGHANIGSKVFVRFFWFCFYFFNDLLKACVRQLLFFHSFGGDFDAQVTTGGAVYVEPFTSNVSHNEVDVEAYLVPVKRFASYDMIYCSVRVCESLENSDLFASPLLASVIQLHWRLYGHRKHVCNMFFHLGLMLSYLLTVYFLQSPISPSENAWRTVFVALQVHKVGYVAYFMVHEVLQFKQDGTVWDYLFDPWNLLDVPAYAMVLLGVVLQELDPSSSRLKAVDGITCLLIWFKLLYYMRPFKLFGPMVYVIFLVIFDIRIFLIILFVVVIGFGNAFYVINGGKGDDLEAFRSITHSLRTAISYCLGTFELQDLDNSLYPALMTVLWLVFMVVVAIILLNLLIAIISESYDKVSAGKIPAWRLEQAKVLIDIYAGMPRCEKQCLNDMLDGNPWLQVLKPKRARKRTYKEE